MIHRYDNAHFTERHDADMSAFHKGRPVNFIKGASSLVFFSNLACTAFAAKVVFAGLFSILSVSCCTLDSNAEMTVPHSSKVQKELIIELDEYLAAAPSPLSSNNAASYATDNPLSYALNVYMFDLDKNARLDSRMQAGSDDGTITAYSCCGNKLVCLYGKRGVSTSTLYDESNIESYADIIKYAVSDIRNDDPFNPLLSAKMSLDGKTDSCRMVLQECFSRIRLSKLSCDLSSSPLKGDCLRNVKVYLVNVSARCSIFADEPYTTTEILNDGEMCPGDVASVMYPEFLYKSVEDPVGAQGRKLDLDFYCYPNQNAEDGIGSPFTRLVIEGEIDGKKTYYPLDINRGQWNDVCKIPGVGRNVCYDFDVTILREGTTSPDAAVSEAEVWVKCVISQWNEKNEIYEAF